MGYPGPMGQRSSASIRTATTIVLATAFVGSAVAVADAAPVPRVTEAQCSTIANNSGGTGYVIVDPTTNTSCVVKTNGTFVWASKARACKKAPVKFQGSLLPTNRGDVVAKVKVRYIRGNKVIKKWVKLKPGRSFATKQNFNKKGTWTAAFTYKGNTVTTKIKVVNCTTS